MAALLWTYHVLSPSAISRPCAQIVPGPVSSSDTGGIHLKQCRPLANRQLHKLASKHCNSNLRANNLRHSHEDNCKFRRNSRACQARRSIFEFQLESQEKDVEISSPSQRVRRNLRLPVLKASARATETDETQDERGEKGPAIGNHAWRTISTHVLGAVLMGTILFGVAPAQATDTLKTCSCLLKECRVELARCIADPGCAANVACLQTCNNRPDETECQIACGDLFENPVVDQFNDCAVSRKGCVPQKQDEGRFPIPPPAALVQEFKTEDFTGKWYITSGLNRTFDTFDCQLHEFSAAPNKLTGKLNWRIATPDGGFFTRSAVQNFVQNENQPGVLLNHGNEFLHYQDDWYILSSKIEKGPDDYVFVYYRGSNDAWDGYGGAVVYTRSSTLPQSIIPELSRAAANVGLDFNKFTTTDNTCGPEAPLFARLEKKVEDEEKFIEEEVEEEEMFLVAEAKAVFNTVGNFIANIVKGEVDLFTKGAESFKKEEELLLQELGDEEKKVLEDLNMGAQDIERLFGKAIPIRKLR